MTAQYAVLDDDRTILDPSWACIADVLNTYHGNAFVTPDRRVTGTLVTRHADDQPWTPA